MNATHTNLARAFLQVSELEGQRRRMEVAGRALKKELDDACTGASFSVAELLLMAVVCGVSLEFWYLFLGLAVRGLQLMGVK